MLSRARRGACAGLPRPRWPARPPRRRTRPWRWPAGSPRSGTPGHPPCRRASRTKPGSASGSAHCGPPGHPPAPGGVMVVLAGASLPLLRRVFPGHGPPCPGERRSCTHGGLVQGFSHGLAGTAPGSRAAMTAPDHSRLPLRDYDHLPLASLAHRTARSHRDGNGATSGALRLRSHRTAPPCWTSWPPSDKIFFFFSGRRPVSEVQRPSPRPVTPQQPRRTGNAAARRGRKGRGLT